jgi:hypothetical protein
MCRVYMYTFLPRSSVRINLGDARVCISRDGQV